ncbi:hypothetical protein RF55_7862 [Lasius niger]|uniref:Uncharacterized protein n=1 Tax=Lasius niger TaxID=67767 RepID=A0A0J7NI57_LASNI|nr:hypothetical protein RF55_7862 [Lasius niger]
MGDQPDKPKESLPVADIGMETDQQPGEQEPIPIFDPVNGREGHPHGRGDRLDRASGGGASTVCRGNADHKGGREHRGGLTPLFY